MADSVRPPAWRRLGLLWALYFVQGIPFGFQTTALLVYLRESGISLTAIGLSSVLAIPWMLKFLWAPLIDRFSSRRRGRRRSWILPLQAALALACAAGALADPERHLGPLLALVFVMNLCAATLDIAVDGLAVDLLSVEELGKGNIAQVVGFKIGMLTGGGLLVWASGFIGWNGLFLAMAALVAATLVVTLRFREPPPPLADPDAARPGFGRIFRALRAAVTVRGAVWLLLFVATYKLGESMADTMFRPYLVDEGFSRQQIGLWLGTWGMLFSIAGSTAGGLLASRFPIHSALSLTAVLRVAPLAALWGVAAAGATPARVIAVTCAENFFGGALTTALFAFMMSRVDRRIGATHYTLLAALEVWGKLAAQSVSGAIAEGTSYTFVFALATGLSLAFLCLLPPLRRTARPDGTAVPAGAADGPGSTPRGR